MSDQPMIEIWGAGTMRTLRPLWVLEELGLAYQLAPIGPRTGETQTQEYTELNPKQKIPFLKDGSVKLSESVAMSRYLIERYGDEEGLSIPATIEARAKEDKPLCHAPASGSAHHLRSCRKCGGFSKDLCRKAPCSG